MYFIAKGDCKVSVRDERKNESNVRIIKEGGHFGEISMIYKCRRTATVISRNYNTLARLDEENYLSLISEYPEY
jgi:CRP-like cAMP-binding protein